MRCRARLLLALVFGGCAHPKPWQVPAADPATLRTVAQGQVEGGPGRYGSQAWLGIPFAAPPTGGLRWRSPQDAKPWNGVRSALTFPPGCPQWGTPVVGLDVEPGTLYGQEDCLYLNLWAPPFAPDQVPKGKDRLPVMLWIHGGGNSVGVSSFYEGGRLATDQKVLVITTQYRLGPLGFLRHRALRAGSSDPVEQSGNFGLLDLIQSLKWIQENIAAFGGDPDDVTIFGQSAGGLDVYALLLAPQAKGLFQRAIVESGGVSEVTPDAAERFADESPAGEHNSSGEVLLRLILKDKLATDRAGAKAHLAAMRDADLEAYLRTQSPADLLRAEDGDHTLGEIDMPLVFSDGAVIPAGRWADRFATPGGWNQVPVLVGTNHDEQTFYLFLQPGNIRQRFGLIPQFVNEPNYLATAEWVTRAWKTVAEDEPATAMRRSGATDVYGYRFDWRDEPLLFGTDLAKMIGAAHGLEIPFVFGHFDIGEDAKPLFEERRMGTAQDLSAALRSYWTQFAIAGNPGRGRQGKLPLWSRWEEPAAGLPNLMLLDVPASCNLRMGVAFDRREAVVAGIDADLRLPTPIDKCRVYRELTGWSKALTKEGYLHAGTLGCEKYPLDAYPWPDPGKR